MSRDTWNKHGTLGVCNGCYKTKLIADQRVQLKDNSWRTLYEVRQKGKSASMTRYADSYLTEKLCAITREEITKLSPPEEEAHGVNGEEVISVTRAQARAMYDGGMKEALRKEKAGAEERGETGSPFAWPAVEQEEKSDDDPFARQWLSMSRMAWSFSRPVDQIISKALLAAGVHESPMCGQPQAGTCTWWLKGVKYLEVVFDTGAQDHSCSTALKSFMRNVVESQISMQGAFGGEAVPASDRGELEMVLFTETQIATAMGVECMKFDTIPKATWNLMSGGVLFEMGFDIHLTKKHGHQLIRHNDDNTQTILPFEYNSEARTWIARVLVSRQSGQAQKLCRRILARIERGQEWKFF
jgi:hypothetical protein